MSKLRCELCSADIVLGLKSKSFKGGWCDNKDCERYWKKLDRQPPLWKAIWVVKPQ